MILPGKIVDFLLSKGANAAIADNEGWTPAAVSAGLRTFSVTLALPFRIIYLGYG